MRAYRFHDACILPNSAQIAITFGGHRMSASSGTRMFANSRPLDVHFWLPTACAPPLATACRHPVDLRMSHIRWSTGWPYPGAHPVRHAVATSWHPVDLRMFKTPVYKGFAHTLSHARYNCATIRANAWCATETRAFTQWLWCVLQSWRSIVMIVGIHVASDKSWEVV